MMLTSIQWITMNQILVFMQDECYKPEPLVFQTAHSSVQILFSFVISIIPTGSDHRQDPISSPVLFGGRGAGFQGIDCRGRCPFCEPKNSIPSFHRWFCWIHRIVTQLRNSYNGSEQGKVWGSMLDVSSLWVRRERPPPSDRVQVLGYS